VMAPVLRVGGRRIAIPKGSLEVSKLEAAEAHLKAAVRLYFSNDHIVPVLTLANAAREVVATLGEKGGVKTLQDHIAEHLTLTPREVVKNISKIANFLKHADRDPTATVEVTELTIVTVLQLACHDFFKVKGEKRIEVEFFEKWLVAATVEKVSELPLRWRAFIRELLQMMPPGFRSADWNTKKAMGLRLLNEQSQ
jgi:hypothetical protein